jgi:Zn-dependent peptidase ImmA (M78 family)
VTFVSDAQLEARAAAIWRARRLQPNFDAEALIDDLGLRLMWDAIEDTLDENIFGALIPSRRRVILNERHRETLDRNLGLRRFTIAHEVGHWELHVKTTGTDQLAYIDGDRPWCRQRSADPLEIQAERFSAFLITPTELLVPRLPPGQWSGWDPVRELASYFGTSLTAMIVRLEKGGWAHRDESGYPYSGRPHVDSPQLVLPTGE